MPSPATAARNLPSWCPPPRKRRAFGWLFGRGPAPCGIATASRRHAPNFVCRDTICALFRDTGRRRARMDRGRREGRFVTHARELLQTIAATLDGLDIAMCAFDSDDRTVLWNRAFLRYFPEHADHVFAGE